MSTSLTANDFINGFCDSFALALIEDHPGLKLAVIGYQTENGWWPTHYLAHDDEFAYDAVGSYDLSEPLSSHFGCNAHYLDQPVEDWFVDKHPENGDYRQEARQLMKNLPWIVELLS